MKKKSAIVAVALVIVVILVTCLKLWKPSLGADRDADTAPNSEARDARHPRTDVPRPKTKPQGSAAENLSGKSDDELIALFSDFRSSDMPLDEMRKAHCMIIEALEGRGRYDDALDLALSYNQGGYRNALVYSLFSKSGKNLEALIARIGDARFSEEDRMLARTGVSVNLSRYGGAEKIQELVQSGRPIKSSEVGFLIGGLIQRIDPGRLSAFYYSDQTVDSSSPGDAERLARLNGVKAEIQMLTGKSPELAGEAYTVLAGMLAAAMPNESISVVKDNLDLIGKARSEELLQRPISNLFLNSPKQALATLADLATKIDVTKMAKAGYENWLGTDSKAFCNWLVGNGSGIDRKLSNQAYTSAVDFFLDQKDMGQVSELVSSISDPDTRSQIQKAVANREADWYQEKAQKDLVGHLDDLAGSVSSVPSSYIERTFESYVEKEPAAAQKWYENNWGKLPAEKAQYIAAAYVKSSLKQMDVATAEKWAGFITDPEVRKRIESEIDRVAGPRMQE